MDIINLRPHHLENLIEYSHDREANSALEFTYGPESTLCTGDIFDKILNKEVQIRLILGYDIICSQCRARRRKGCYVFDGLKGIFISEKRILRQDRQALKKFRLKPNRVYPAISILDVLGI
jgi:hypothetical protein